MEDDGVEKVKQILSKAEGKIQSQFQVLFEQLDTLAREIETVKAQQRVIGLNEVHNIINLGLLATELNALHELIKRKYPEDYAEIQKALAAAVPKDLK